MKKPFLFLFVSLFLFQSCAQQKVIEKEVTTYYLIRHAEKNRSDKTNKNPNLTAQGLQRANLWAKYFKKVTFDVVYTTNYNRTIQTATPTAKANNVALQFYDPRNLDVEEFMLKTKGKTILIVGHSDSTPKLTNALLGEDKYEGISDDNNANLYVVTVNKNSKNAKLSVVTMDK